MILTFPIPFAKSLYFDNIHIGLLILILAVWVKWCLVYAEMYYLLYKYNFNFRDLWQSLFKNWMGPSNIRSRSKKTPLSLKLLATRRVEGNQHMTFRSYLKETTCIVFLRSHEILSKTSFITIHVHYSVNCADKCNASLCSLLYEKWAPQNGVSMQYIFNAIYAKSLHSQNAH